MRRLLNKPVPSSPVDDGLREIAAWHSWFLRAHEQRFRDLDLPADQYETELAECRRLGAAMVERMKVQFLARQR
jgi:hypothetical protein